jgi:hypothetical protein
MSEKKGAVTVLFNVVPQTAIGGFQSQHQLPMTDHWGPIHGPIRPGKKKGCTNIKEMSGDCAIYIVPQTAIETFQSQHQLPMTDHWGPIQGPSQRRDKKKKMMEVDYKQE